MNFTCEKFLKPCRQVSWQILQKSTTVHKTRRETDRNTNTGRKELADGFPVRETNKRKKERMGEERNRSRKLKKVKMMT